MFCFVSGRNSVLLIFQLEGCFYSQGSLQEPTVPFIDKVLRLYLIRAVCSGPRETGSRTGSHTECSWYKEMAQCCTTTPRFHNQWADTSSSWAWTEIMRDDPSSTGQKMFIGSLRFSCGTLMRKILVVVLRPVPSHFCTEVCTGMLNLFHFKAEVQSLLNISLIHFMKH